MKFTYLFLCLLITSPIAGGCAATSGSDSARPSADGSNSDADSDADSDSDTDSDADGDWSGEGMDTDDGFIPETEQRFDYRIPVSSGKFVFIADKLNNKVIAVDSITLEIFTTEVGATPTHIIPLNDNGHVAVISLNADEVTIIRMNANGSATVTEQDVRPDTNALAVSHNGRYVIAFWDSLFELDSGIPNTTQEISIIDTTLGAERNFEVTVGIHPNQILFNQNDTKAFVISNSGIDIIDLAALNTAYFPDHISLFDFTTIDPDETETLIDVTGTYAIGRREDTAAAFVALLDDSEEPRTYELNGIPSDIDLSTDGSFGVFTIRGTHEAAFFNLPLPRDPAVNPFTYVDLGSQYCGAATLSNDGQFIALYTSVDDDDSNRKVLTLIHKNGDTYEVDNTLLNRNIKGIHPAPDSGALLVVHEYLNTSNNSSLGTPYSYSLVKLPGLQSKFQQLDVDPTQMLITEDGSYAYMLLSTQEIQIINMDTFIVDSLSLGSLPTAAGYTSLTDKVFIAQEHPSGRMTFMDVDGENVKTITGYTLNDQSTN